jgi:hypothetical protein
VRDGREVDGEQVEVRRSARRVRTVSAYRDGRTIVVLVPARLGPAEERAWVDRLVERVRARDSRRRRGDLGLADRAARLSATYLAGRARPSSVSWSSSQRRRWGSCTPVAGTIRISDRARGAPEWVLDYLLVHELAHLIEPSHSARFWRLVSAYPRSERARGWLEGFDAAAGETDRTPAPES